MKTVTAAFNLEQAKPSAKYVREIYYKRRYWVESTKTYTWESSWTRIPESDVAGMSAVNWSLDTDQLNEFKVSNVTLQLKNDNNQWKSDNQSGKFYRDSVSMFDYLPFWTKFQVKVGLELADGTTETVAAFTGVATEYVFDSVSDRVQITVSGLEVILENGDAERVSTTVTLETLTGSVNGSNKVFTTANTGVGGITQVTDNGADVALGSQLDVSNLNVKGTVATLTWVTAPVSGHVVKATYFYWKVNQKFEDLVLSLISEVGITSYSIDPVVFNSALQNTWTQTSEADFELGTLTRINSTKDAGTIRIEADNTAHKVLLDDFSGSLATNFPTNVGGAFSISGGKLNFTSPAGANYLSFHAGSLWGPQTKAYGVWQMTYKNNITNTDVHTLYSFITADGQISSLGDNFPNGYYFQITSFSGTNQSYILFLGNHTVGGSAAAGHGQIGVQYFFTRDTATHTIRIVRETDGQWYFYWDNVLIISGVNNGMTTSSYMGFYDLGPINSPLNLFDLDDIYTPSSTLTGTWTSQVLDAGPSVTNWGHLSGAFSDGGGTLQPYTRVSSDNITYDAWVATTGATNIIGSALKRYIQVKFEFATSSLAYQDPYVSDYTLSYTTQSTFISLANFTGQTVYDAIQTLAQLPNYEWGFKPDESFFFRQRSTDSDPDLDMDHKTNVAHIMSVQSGYDKTYSVVKVTHGSFKAQVTDDGNNYLSPLKRLTRSILEIDSGSLLVKEDVDIATNTAKQFYFQYSRPKRIYRLKTKLYPQLDLADVVRLNYKDITSRKKEWFMGDTNVYLGDSDLNMWGGSEQHANAFLGKVVGIRYDTENWGCEVDLEEILS